MTSGTEDLHPGAWWIWGVGLATASVRTTNPVILAITIAVVSLVVAARRSGGPWARAFRFYLLAGGFVVATRIAFRVVFGDGSGAHVLFSLPSLPLPAWMAGVTIGGSVTSQALLSGLYDGMRLATMLICVGAINALADPRRLLRSLPKGLYEIGTAIVVAVNLVPQVIESVHRVRRARRLRGGTSKGIGSLRATAVPVFEDAVARSIALAASMDARGFGRATQVSAHDRRLVSGLMLGGLTGIVVGLYALFDGAVGTSVTVTTLILGVALAVIGLVVAGRRIERTRYRPDRWRSGELIVSALGVMVAAVFVLSPVGLHPPTDPFSWPLLPLLPASAMLAGAAPALLRPTGLRRTTGPVPEMRTAS
jgi:energy-coupling factor transport system permease protein